MPVKIIGLTPKNVRALREVLRPEDYTRLRVTEHAAVFDMDGERAVQFMGEVMHRAGAEHGRIGFPYRSLVLVVLKVVEAADAWPVPISKRLHAFVQRGIPLDLEYNAALNALILGAEPTDRPVHTLVPRALFDSLWVYAGRMLGSDDQHEVQAGRRVLKELHHAGFFPGLRIGPGR